MRIAEWIIGNLNEHGNCALPTNLVTLYGIKQVEDEISKLVGYQVRIEKRRIGNYGYSPVLCGNEKKGGETLYLAVKA